MTPIDVFVSYDRKDQSRVEPIVSGLMGEGLRVFWDRSLELGANWLRELNAHLDATPCIVVIWSKISINSAFVQAEAMKGFERQVLAPILIDAGVRPPAPFGIIQSSTILPGTNGDWQALVTRVKGLVAKAHAQAAPLSANELADQVQAAKATQQTEIKAIVEPLRRVAASAEVAQTTVDQSLHKAHNHLLRDDLFSIAVVGRMKVGKSTLLNALLGLPEGVPESPLPADDDPCTATLIRLRYSDEPYCRPHEWDHARNAIGKPLPDWTFDKFQREARIYNDGKETNLFNDIAEFEVGWPSPLLRQGVTLIDTPGISENPSRTELTRSAIADVDAAIVVYRSEPLAGTDEIDFAQDVTGRVGKVFTLVNLRGNHAMPTTTKFQNVVRSRLSLEPKCSLEDQDVFLSQLIDALNAKKRRDGQLSDASGLRQFELRLAGFLISERYSAHLLKTIREIRPLAESLLSTIRTLTAGAQADSGKLQEAIAACNDDLDKIRRKKGTINSLIVAAHSSASSAAQRSFEAKVSSIANAMPEKIDSLNLGINSFLDKIGAGTIQGKKWTKLTADKIYAVARQELEEWASAENDKPGLARDLKPTVDQLVSSLKSQAEDIADTVKRMRARIAALDPGADTDANLMSDMEKFGAAILGTILFGPFGIVGLGGWRGVVGATGGAVLGGIGVGLAVALLHIAFPPTIVFTAISGAFAVGGAIVGSTQGLEKRLKKRAWEAVEPNLRSMASNPQSQEQLRTSIDGWFADMQNKLADGLAKIIGIEQQMIAKLDELSSATGNQSERIGKLDAHKKVVDDALSRAKKLELEIERALQGKRQ